MIRTRTTAGATAAAALSLLAGTAVAAPKPANLQLIAGAHVAVVNLLDPEVTHFHASRHLQNSFLKTYTLEWSVSAMLMEAVRERLTQMGLVPVAAAATEAVRRAREACFLDAASAEIHARQWGGDQIQTWTGFKLPPDLKDIPDQQLSQLQPLFAAMLKQQVSGVLEHLQVTR